MIKKCLMIRVDNKTYFTDTKNIPNLNEFAKTFSAELFIAEVENPTILSLTQLAAAVCNPDFKQKPFEVIQIIKSSKRKDLISNASEIKSFIKKSFLDNQIVSLAELAEKFNKVTKACLCNHMKTVKKDLQKAGVDIVKLRAGNYKLK